MEEKNERNIKRNSLGSNRSNSCRSVIIGNYCVTFVHKSGENERTQMVMDPYYSFYKYYRTSTLLRHWEAK